MNSSDSRNFKVSDRMKWFSKSLEPAILKLEQTLEQKEPTNSKTDDVATLASFFDQVKLCLDHVQAFIHKLETWLKNMNEQVVNNPDVDMATVYRYGGQFELIIDLFISLYQRILEQADYQFEDLYELLKKGLEKILRQILEWMENVHNVIERPDLYCHPNEKENQSGVIELMIELELDMPDEFDLLHDKLKDSVQSSDLLADELEDTVESKQQSSGCLGIIGDIGSGLLIYNWLFGK